MDNKKKFRLQSTRVFITFPQCETTPEVALERIKKSTKTNNCKAVIAQEDHKDGNKHLHIFIESTKAFNVRDATYFDFIGGKHGDCQKVKCKEAVLKYITKENNWISHEIDVLKVLQEWAAKLDKKRKREDGRSRTQKIYKFLSDGGKYEDLIKDPELGSFCIIHGNQVKSFATDLQMEQLKKEKEEKKPKYLHFVLNGMEYDMLEPMPFKTPQFWIYGPPNTGKSTFIKKLEETGLCGFEIPVNNDFASWNDDNYDFAYIDEFKGQLTIQFLNLFLQGGKMTLPGKYVAGGRTKNKNIPVFILSNYTPEEVYHKKSNRDLEPLLCRLRVINLQSFQDYAIITSPLLDTNGSPIYLNDLYCDEELVD